MKKFHFREATPLIEFIEQHRNQIVGHPLNELLTHYWPVKNRKVISDELVVLKLDNYCLVVDYVFYSDLTLIVCDEVAPC